MPELKANESFQLFFLRLTGNIYMAVRNNYKLRIGGIFCCIMS